MGKKKNENNIIILKAVFYILFWWLLLIIFIIKKCIQNKKKKNKSNIATNIDTNYANYSNLNQNNYKTKQLMSEYEKYFFNILTENFSDTYLIMPQVNLATIINKIKDYPKQYQNELYRNIDFGIFDKQTMQPLLLIEINDKTHERKDRIKRDIKVKEICNKANIDLITFYSKFDNKKEYIINRVTSELQKQKH